MSSKVKENVKKWIDKFKKFRKTKTGGIVCQIVSSLFMLAVAAGIGIFLAVGKVKGGPTIFAEEYFSYYAANNWYSMYENTEVKESRFINRSAFIRYMSQNEIPREVESFEVAEVDKDGDYAKVKINYVMKNEEESVSNLAPGDEQDTGEEITQETTEQITSKKINNKGTCTLKIKRQEENIMLFYSTWLGDIESDIIKDCTISIPDGFTLKFDSDDVEDLHKKNAETGMKTYKIDRIFKGIHKLEVSGNGIDTKTIEVNWNKDKSEHHISITDLGISDEMLKEIETKTKQLLLKYYESALLNVGAEPIKELVSGDEAVKESIDNQYKELLANINKEDGAMLSTLDIVSCKCTIDEYVYMESAKVTAEYTANYSAKKARNIVYGVRESYVGTNTATMTLSLKYVDGVWTIVDSNMTCIDYSVETE